MIRVLGAMGIMFALSSCEDFRHGLACAADSDCLGYMCVRSVCTTGVNDESSDQTEWPNDPKNLTEFTYVREMPMWSLQ